MDKPQLIKGAVHVDDRGMVTFCNDFDMSEVKRWYMLENYQQGYVRAWHGHIKEAKWVTCVSGAAVEAVMKIKKMVPGGEREHPNDLIANCKKTKELFFVSEPERYTLHPNGDVLYVPPGYANGHMNLVQGTRLIHFSNLLHEDTVGDDVRFDSSIHGQVWEVEPR